MDQRVGPGRGTQVEEEAGVLVCRAVGPSMPVSSKVRKQRLAFQRFSWVCFLSCHRRDYRCLALEAPLSSEGTQLRQPSSSSHSGSSMTGCSAQPRPGVASASWSLMTLLAYCQPSQRSGNTCASSPAKSATWAPGANGPQFDQG